MIRMNYEAGEIQPFYVTQELVATVGLDAIKKMEEERYPHRDASFFWEIKYDKYRHTFRLSGRWVKVHYSPIVFDTSDESVLE